MAVTYKGFGQASNTNSKATTALSATITLNFTPAVGDCIVVMWLFDTGGTGGSASGAGVSTWKSSPTEAYTGSTGGYMRMWYGSVTTAGTSTVTVTTPVGAYTLSCLAIGFSSGLDMNATQVGASNSGTSTAPDSGTLTSALQGVVVTSAGWGSTATLSNALSATSPSTGWTDPFTGGAQRVTTAGASHNGAFSLGLAGAWYDATSNSGSTAFETTSTISASSAWGGLVMLIPALPTVPPATAPTLSVTTTNGGATLSWNSVSLASSYKVYRDGVLLRTVSSTSTSDSGLTTGQQYSYYVVPSNGIGDGPASNTVTITATATVTLHGGGNTWYASARTTTSLNFATSTGPLSMAANSMGVICVGFDNATATVASITSQVGVTWSLVNRVHGAANTTEIWTANYITGASDGPTVTFSTAVEGVAFIANFINAQNGWESPTSDAQSLGAVATNTQTAPQSIVVSNDGAMEVVCGTNVWDATNIAYLYPVGSGVSWGSQPLYDSSTVSQGSFGAGSRAVSSTTTTSDPCYLYITGGSGTSQMNYSVASAIIVGTTPVGGGTPTPTEGGSGLRVISKMR